jgi:chemotaxis protein methyltransferase CheR
MVVLEAIPEAHRLDVRILATDIDPHVLAIATSALYDANQVEAIPKCLRERYTLSSDASGASHPKFRVSDEARRLVSFRQLNLLSDWPMRGRFDVILCRNVVIYFDRETQKSLWRRFEERLQPGGHLLLGHSERIDTSVHSAFQMAGTTTYQRAISGGTAATRS